MTNVIPPIHSQAARKGKVSDVIHAVALDMMKRRSHLLQYSTKVSKNETRSCRKQARLLEEYAAILEVIYYQLEPERWDPETSTEILQLAQVHHIALPDWMLPDGMKPGKTPDNEPMEETIEFALYRFENEGGRNSKSAAT